MQITNTNDGFFHGSPQISGTTVVWEAWDGNDFEILAWDGNSTSQLTDNSFDDRFPQISEQTVVWEGFEGNDTEIFLAAFSIPEPTTSTLALAATLLLVGGRQRR